MEVKGWRKEGAEGSQMKTKTGRLSQGRWFWRSCRRFILNLVELHLDLNQIIHKILKFFKLVAR